MFTAKQFRANAAECTESLKNTEVPSEVRDLQRSKLSFNALADNEDWLAKNYDKMIRSGDAIAPNDEVETSVVREPVAQSDEHVLRCLGAAVIMQWNTIPTKLQRELFDTAGSMGDMLKSAELRGQIARFLHKQKDLDRPTGFIFEPNMREGLSRA